MSAAPSPHQSGALRVASSDYKVLDVAKELHEKAKRTLQPIAPLDTGTQW